MDFQIRFATLEDTTELRDLSEATFRDTYTALNTPENMEQHVAEKFTLEKIKNDIQSTDNQHFVIESANQIVAFAKLVKHHSTEGLTEKKVVEIERFYVDKNLHGQQLGRKLMDCCVVWAKQNDFEVIWLGVWEKNPNAIKFYQKMGFEFLGKHTFVLGTDEQTDFTMRFDISLSNLSPKTIYESKTTT